MGANFNASDLPQDTVSIMLSPDTFANQSMADTSIVFSVFNRSDLYPLFNQTLPGFGVASSVVSATVVGSDNISGNITVVLRLNIEVGERSVHFTVFMHVSLLTTCRALRFHRAYFGMLVLQVLVCMHRPMFSQSCQL